MAKGIFRVRAKVIEGRTIVKMMARHNMETGRRRDRESGELIPARFLRQLQVHHAGKLVFQASLGTAVSKNPYFGFSFDGGASGDELTLQWQENTGTAGTETAQIR